MPSGHYSSSTVRGHTYMGRRHDHQGHVRNHPLESIDGSGDLTTIPPHPYGEDDILTEVKRQHREDGNNRQRHVTFGNVMIEGGDVIGTSRVDEEVEFGDAGDVLSSELDREVLNTILETGTDEKGRRVLKERYAKLNPEARRQREIRLAQYSGFAMRSDGTLDYGIDNSPLPKKPSFMKKLLNRLV